MINGSETSKIVKRRPRRAFNLEDKKRFYIQWKASGVKKNDLCIQNDLSPSVEPLVKLGKTLYQWREAIARMWRFTKLNGITEGFHRKMKLMQRRAY